MEDFEYLNEFLDSMIDKNLICRNRLSRSDNEKFDRSIMLYDIEMCNFDDEELNYVMNYLNDRNICVLGSSPALYTGFPNYRYVLKSSVPRKSLELSQEEQFELIKKYRKTHDITYRNKVVESFIRMVNSIAVKYIDITGIDQDELASYGYEGLMVAIDNLDLSKKFSSAYIFRIINGYILNGITKEQGFKCSNNFHLDYVKARKKVLKEHEEENVSEYDLLEEILKETFKDRKDSEFSRKKSRNMFYAAYASSLEDVEIIDENNKIDEIIEEVFQEELKDITVDFFEILTPRQKEILMMRFGFNDDYMSLPKIAKELGISNNGVNLTVKRSIKKLENNRLLYKELRDFNNNNYKI